MAARNEGEENEKEKKGGKNIHPDRIEVGCSSPGHIFERKKARPEHQVFQGTEELSVEMSNIIKEMSE